MLVVVVNGTFNVHYTWGAYGKSPIGIRYKLPKKLIGLKTLKVAVNLQGNKQTKTMSYHSYVDSPRTAIDSLLKRYQKVLSSIDLDLKALNPKSKPELYRLALLDQKLILAGKGSIFKTQKRRLAFTKTNRYTNTFSTKVPGLYKMLLNVTGKTRAGYLYQRQARFNVHITKS